MEKFLSKDQAFYKLVEEVSKCKACKLCGLCQHRCPGLGNLNAKVMFIGEAPGRVDNPELRGLPFVGNKSSDLLLECIYSNWEYGYDDVYITNVVKCNPPMNRKPEDEEIYACTKFLKEEIKLVDPKIIVCLGRTAANWFGIREGLNSCLDKEYKWEGRLVKVLYHPAYVLRFGNQAALQYLALFKLMKKGINKIC